MSDSTHSFARRKFLRVVGAASAGAAFGATAIASISVSAETRAGDDEIPVALRAITGPLRLQGEGETRWLGLLVYRARLWTRSETWRADQPHVLDIRYAMDIAGERLADRSVVEMRHIAAGTDTQRVEWLREMRKLFPDVRKSDRLIGLANPGGQTRFFLNDKPIGAIDDPAFGPAFFGIWLSPSTSHPELRRRLLRLAE